MRANPPPPPVVKKIGQPFDKVWYIFIVVIIYRLSPSPLSLGGHHLSIFSYDNFSTYHHYCKGGKRQIRCHHHHYHHHLQ